jgi:hypothetical protein
MWIPAFCCFFFVPFVFFVVKLASSAFDAEIDQSSADLYNPLVSKA